MSVLSLLSLSLLSMYLPLSIYESLYLILFPSPCSSSAEIVVAQKTSGSLELPLSDLQALVKEKLYPVSVDPTMMEVGVRAGGRGGGGGG